MVYLKHVVPKQIHILYSVSPFKVFEVVVRQLSGSLYQQPVILTKCALSGKVNSTQ